MDAQWTLWLKSLDCGRVQKLIATPAHGVCVLVLNRIFICLCCSLITDQSFSYVCPTLGGGGYFRISGWVVSTTTTLYPRGVGHFVGGWAGAEGFRRKHLPFPAVR